MAVHIPKYIKVKEAILNDIRCGKYRVGDKLPIREEMINTYSVTRTTIDKAFRELISEGVIQASRKLGTFVADVNVKLKVAVVSNLREPHNESGSGNDLSKMLYQLIANASDFKLDFFVPGDVVDKLGFLAGYDRVVWTQPDDEVIELLDNIKSKVIITNRYFEHFNFVSTNHRQSIFDVTDFMLTHCPKESNIFYIGPAKNDFVTKERCEGFIEACSRHQRFYRLLEADLGSFEYSSDVLRSMQADQKQATILIAPSRCYTGAALAYERENDLKLYKNFFYSDVDNENALQITGTKIVSIIQDYEKMGEKLVEAIKHDGNDLYQCFVPHLLNNTELLEV